MGRVWPRRRRRGRPLDSIASSHMVAAVPDNVSALARTRPGDVIRHDPDAASAALQQLGVDPDSQMAAFFRQFCAVNMLSTSSYESLSDPCEPTPQMALGTRFVREVWGLPDEYVCLTSCEGEGCYLYSTRTGAVYDFELASRERFLAAPVETWRDFNTFIEWFLTPGWKRES